MFIGRSTKPNNKLRSEERNTLSRLTTQNHAAPPNGVGRRIAPGIHKYVTAGGVKSILYSTAPCSFKSLATALAL